MREQGTKKCISFLNELEQMLIGPFSNDLQFRFSQTYFFRHFFVDRMQQNTMIYSTNFTSMQLRNYEKFLFCFNLQVILLFEIDVLFLIYIPEGNCNLIGSISSTKCQKINSSHIINYLACNNLKIVM